MTTIERQFEMTDGLYTFIFHLKNGRLGPDHDDALYHVPGQTVSKRWVLKHLFPGLRDTVREIEVGPEPRPERKRGRPMPPEREEALTLAKSGLSVMQIAKQMDRAVGTVRYWVQK